jgi:hypothetical protein
VVGVSARVWFRSVILTLITSAAAWGQPSAAIVLGPQLVEWRDEIEALGNYRVILVRIYTDDVRGVMILPRDAEERPVLATYLRNENFRREFVATHAVTVEHPGENKRLYFVLLNMAREAEWNGNEDAVLAHEFGHIWLLAQNLPAPRYEGKSDSCVSILTNDAIQHGLIREEFRRRGIDYNSYWLPMLQQSLAKMEFTDPVPTEEIPTCHLLSKLVLWLDVSMGLSAETWPQRDRFLAAMERQYPILRDMVKQLSGTLEEADLTDRSEYEKTLTHVLYSLQSFTQLVLKRGGG